MTCSMPGRQSELVPCTDQALMPGLPDLVRVIPEGCLAVASEPRTGDFARRVTMFRWLTRRWIAAFERKYDYDMSYVREMLEVSPRAVRLFGRIGALGQYRRGVPVEAYGAAAIVAARWEDCGPCTQLAVTMAERAGVAPAMLRAVIARGERAMAADTRRHIAV
jgi:hypothetical protein